MIYQRIVYCFQYRHIFIDKLSSWFHYLMIYGSCLYRLLYFVLNHMNNSHSIFLLWNEEKLVIYATWKIFYQKSHLEESLNQLKKKINEDITQEWVSIINLDEIHKIINTLSDILSIITWPLISFRKAEKTLQEEQKLVLEKFITLEQIWISEYINTFKALLKIWMETHANELKSEILTIEKSRIDSLVTLYIENQVQEAQNIKIIL